jgi:hypothetical protein
MKSDADIMQYLSAIEYFWAVELARNTQKKKKTLRYCTSEAAKPLFLCGFVSLGRPN